MAYNWGPNFIMPSDTLRKFTGRVVLREDYNETLLRQELAELGCGDQPFHVTNPWYYREKNAESWIKIGESSDRKNQFSVPWDTRSVGNGEYELLGFMHVYSKKGAEEFVVTRQNIVDVTIEN